MSMNFGFRLEDLGLDPYDQMENAGMVDPPQFVKPEPDHFHAESVPVLESLPYPSYPPLEQVEEFRYSEYTEANAFAPPTLAPHFPVAPPLGYQSQSSSVDVVSESYYTQQPGMTSAQMLMGTAGTFTDGLMPLETSIGTLPPPPQLQMQMQMPYMAMPGMPMTMDMPPLPVDADLGDEEDEKPKRAVKKAAKEVPKKRKPRAQGEAATASAQEEAPTPEAKKAMSEEELAEFKRQQRLMRNRASAQLSRERKKAHLKDLEKQLKELMTLNSNLAGQVNALKSENNTLKKRLGLPPVPANGIPIPVSSAASASGWPQPHSDTSSDESSPPASPELQMAGQSPPHLDEEIRYAYSASASPRPHAANAQTNKRQKVAHSPGSAGYFLSRHPNLSRTGVLLFALMFSFGIFFHMTGVPLKASDITSLSAEEMKEIHHSVDSTLRKFVGGVAPSATVRLGRVLNAVDADQVVDMASLNQGAVGRLPSPYSASGEDGSTPVVKKEKKTPVVKVDKSQDLALVSLRERKVTEPSEGDEKALDLYKVPEADVLDGTNIGGYEPLNLFKKVLVDSNFTFDANASYLFCPSAIQVQPPTPTASVAKVAKKRTATTRLRSRGLPAPADSNKKLDNARPQGSKLMLWVPTSSLMTGSLASLTGSTGFYSAEPWEDASGSMNATDGKMKQSGITEILCDITHIRPILLPDES